EEDIRVPFVVRGPGVPAGRKVNRLAGNTDIAPTLTDLAGLETPPLVDGRSLRPLLGEHLPAKRDWRQGVPLGTGTPRAPPPGVPGGGAKPYTAQTRGQVYLPEFTGVRSDRYLYLQYVTGERELYDLRDDPFQLHNLAGGKPDIVGRMAAWLSAIQN